ncbi:MAG: DUF2520 domain-containing protein [Planctomycetota bacterium]
MRRVVIIGAGQAGQTLGRLLNRSGRYKVTAVWSRKLKNASAAARFIGKCAMVYKDKASAAQQGGIIFITTPDSAIQNTCREIFSSGRKCQDKIVIHCSGSQPSAILKDARKGRNNCIASLHPLQTFANKAETAREFKGTYCVYEGEPRALVVVKDIIRALGGIPVMIKAKDKMLYHIGCVFASNYLVTLIKTAKDFLKQCGLNDKDILRAIKPLVDSSVNNIMTIGIPKALTGPVSRGDTLTIRNHLKAIRKGMKHYLALYRELGWHTIGIALDKGSINKSQGVRLREKLG